MIQRSLILIYPISISKQVAITVIVVAKCRNVNYQPAINSLMRLTHAAGYIGSISAALLSAL